MKSVFVGRMKKHFVLLSFLCGIALADIFTSFAFAEPPAVTSLSPAGGQIGQTVEIKLKGKAGTPPLSLWSDRAGLTAEFPEKPAGTMKLTIPPETVPGVALLRITNAEGSSALRPFVIGTLPEVVETEPNNTIQQALKLESSRVVVNGLFEKSGDVDTVAVSLKAGETLVASMSSAEPFGSPLDAILQVVSPKGFVLEQNDDNWGNDPQIAFTAPSDGTYFVRTFGFPATPNSSIRFAGGADYLYRLTLTTGPFVDHTLPAAVNNAGPTELKLHGWNLSDKLKSQTIAPMATGAETPLWDSAVANVISLPVVAHANLVETSSSSRETPQVVPFPAVVTGQILTRGEVDVFEFEAKKGQRLNLKVDARAFGSQLDPVLHLTDAAGKSLKTADDHSKTDLDNAIVYTIPADGSYRAEVFDRFDHFSNRHAYRLTIEEDLPSFTLTAAADAFVLPLDKPLEIPITVARSGGFAGEIIVQIENLPGGVVCEPVKSEAKGDSSKKVTLKLSRGEEVAAFSGPLAIVGRASEISETTIPATTPVAGTSRTTEHLWLTVPVKAE